MRIKFPQRNTGRDKMVWHDWFAWRPILLQTNDQRWNLIWLETIQRKNIGPGAAIGDNGHWEYAELKS